MDRRALSRAVRIVLPPSLLPGSPAAAAALERRLAAVAEGDAVVLQAAWMLAALPHRLPFFRELASAGRLTVGEDWVDLDPYALPGYRMPNRGAAASLLAAFPGVATRPVEGAPGEEGHAGRAGLCLEQRALGDRLVGRAASMPAALPALLPALTAAGIGGRGDAVTEAQACAILRSACAGLGVDAQPSLEPPAVRSVLPRRVRQLALRATDLEVRWSRSKGVQWALGNLREAGSLLSLEVQGDRGGRGGFAPGHPQRPRIFEARDLSPRLHASGEDADHLVLARQLRLPEDPDEPKGRRSWMHCSLSLRLDKGRRGLDALFALDNPAPGQRYRLWFPVPFHPRPSLIAVIGASGRIATEERDGPFPATPAMGPIALRTRGLELQIGGAGFREVEVLRRKNDWICAVTLLRAPAGEPAPRRVVRMLRVSLRRS